MDEYKKYFEWNEKNRRVYLAAIVYIFLSALYCRSIWIEQEIKTIDCVWIWIYLLIPLLCVASLGVMCQRVRNAQFDDIYCRKRDVTFNKLRQWPLRPSWKKIIYIMIGVFGIVMVCISGESSFNVLDMVMTKYSLKIENIKTILEIYALIIALIPIVYTYIERKYMLFDFENLPSIRWFGILLPVSIVVLTATLGCELFFSEFAWCNRFSTLGWVLWWGIVIVSVLKLTLVILPGKNLERKVLESLDTAFWNKNLYVVPNKSWYRSNAIVTITKLFEGYLRKTQNINIEEIQSIQFKCVYKKDDDNVILTRRKILFVFFVILLICGMASSMLMEEFGAGIEVFWIMLSACLAFVIPFKGNSTDILFVNGFYIDSWGYYFKDRKKTKICVFI